MNIRSVLLLFFGLSLFALLGCVNENRIAPLNKEVVQSSEFIDLDDDGQWDYGVYEFSEINAQQGVKIKRRLAVSAATGSEYDSFNFLTDLNLLEADGYLETFSREKKQAEEQCAERVGLIGVNCIDVATCANLCAANSINCKKTASEYKDVLGGSMIYFVQDSSYMDSSLLEARNLVLKLRTASDDEKNVYLEKTREIIARAASLNANPLIFHPKLGLCAHSDYGVANLVDAAKKIGNYSSSVVGYTYMMTVDVEPLPGGGLASQMNGIEIEDGIPAAVVPDPDAISSHEDISASVQGDDLKIRWSSSKISDAGYILYYRFSSERPPEELVNALVAPTVTLKTLDLSALGPTNSLFLLFSGITGNYYISVGLAVGITLAFLLLLYTVIVLAVNIASVTLANRTVAYGVKKAFGRTRVRWQIDGAAALLLFLLGFYVSAYFAPEPFGMPTLVNSLDILISEPAAFAGTALILLGTLMAYFTLENLAKIIMLERIYGVSVREERSAYLAEIVALKEKLETLKKTVKQYAADNFDVSEEYNAISSIPSEKLRDFEKKMTPYSRAMLDDYTDRVETAMEKLAEKRKLADENWPKWKETIAKMLTEHNEVHTTSLISMPVALRQWALAKYIKESPEEGLILEESAIKRRKLAPVVLIKEMVSAGYIRGGMIMKKENLLAAWFEKDESPTVAAALEFKLRLYLSSLAKAMELGELVSFASVGDDTVFVLMKSDSYDTGIFIVKERFKDAVEAWKNKLKMLSEEG